ncbi:MAG: membrane dipeptidase [Phycisphaerae bacterium]|nr:membrane dipeptidase [Saprospiraceae bacterium]
MQRTTLLLFGLLTLFSCTENKPQDEYLRRAHALLATTPIVDTHIDFPWHLVEHKKWYTPGYTAFALKNPDGDFDWERAKKGGLYGPFMSIYIPASFQKEPGRSKQVADSLIDMVNAIVKDYPDKFALAPQADDVLANFKKGIVSLPMGMENGSPLDKIEDVAYFHQRGIRYVTLTHGKDNQISDSSYDTLHTHHGLSEYGREVVREMNRVGIMVDVSHLSDEAIMDVLEVAKKPLIATHSACRHFTPGFERNLPDSLIRAIAKTGGVVQVPFSQYFLGGKVRDAWKKADEEREAKKIPEFGPEALAFYQEFGKKNGEPFWISVREVTDHIDHIKNLVGIDYVGIGSDFDGVGLALPPDLDDVDEYPNLIAELLRRGYSDDDVRKICSGNVLRVWKANE